ncbi:MAG TPA: hypothetical protein VEV87_05265 [Chitinophagaceae bacterium]|nr:hypothetical protein [Chitinophagaceae bacterium]
MKQIFYSIAFISFLQLYSSCQKELSATSDQGKTCKLASATYYLAFGGVYDSSAFVYNGDKVIRAESEIKTITYGFNGSNITTRTYFDKLANAVSFSDTSEYDASNRLKKLTAWFYPGRFAQETTKITYLFNYNGDFVDKVTSIQQAYPNNSTSDTLHNIFRVDAAGNTENIITVDNIGNIYDSVHYAYDRNPNYFKKIHPNYFIFDVNFQMQGNYLHHLPYFFSTNNVTEFSYYGTGTYPVGYEMDSLKNMSSVSVSGSPYVTYRYDCK